MSKVTFVMGISGSGKSFYIKEHFKDIKILDLYSYQIKKRILNAQTVMESYEELKNDILESIKNNEDVVVEHTFLRAIRRKVYIDAIREISSDEINVVLINPPISVIKDRKKERNIYYNDEEILKNLEVLEIPTIEEGFNNVTIIS